MKKQNLPLRFALVFLILMVCFYLFYNSSYNHDNIQPSILNFQAYLGALIISLFDSSVQVIANLVRGNGFSVEVSKGCDGMEVTALLIAGILAFPSSWKEKSKGLLWGVLIIGILNILRIPILYWAGSRISKELFDFIHVQGGFILFVTISIGIWAYWIMSILNDRSAKAKKEVNV